MVCGYSPRFHQIAMIQAWRTRRPVLFRAETTDHARPRGRFKTWLRDRALGSIYARCDRLLYVGLTRAKRHLTVTWAGKPSRFLAELEVETKPAKAAEPDDPLYAALKEWRLERARTEERPAYVIFHNSTLAEIVRRAPRTLDELADVPGVGPAKLERYGDDVLAALKG